MVHRRRTTAGRLHRGRVHPLAGAQVAGEELDAVGCLAAVPGEHLDPAAGSYKPPDDPSSKATGAASDQDGYVMAAPPLQDSPHHLAGMSWSIGGLVRHRYDSSRPRNVTAHEHARWQTSSSPKDLLSPAAGLFRAHFLPLAGSRCCPLLASVDDPREPVMYPSSSVRRLVGLVVVGGRRRGGCEHAGVMVRGCHHAVP